MGKIKNINYKDIIIEGKEIPEEFKEVSEKIIEKYLNMRGEKKTTMDIKFQANYNVPTVIECVVNKIPGSRYGTHVNRVDNTYAVSDEFRRAMGVTSNTQYYYKYNITKIKNKIESINVYRSILDIFIKNVIKTFDFTLIIDRLTDNLSKDDKKYEINLLTKFNSENVSDTINTLIQNHRGFYMDTIGESYDPIIFSNLYMYYVTNIDAFIKDKERELLFKIFIEKLIPLTLELQLKELKGEDK